MNLFSTYEGVSNLWTYWDGVVLWFYVPFLCSFPVFRSFLVLSLKYVPFIRVSLELCSVSRLFSFCLFGDISRYSSVSPDTGILPDTGTICHDSPWHVCWLMLIVGNKQVMGSPTCELFVSRFNVCKKTKSFSLSFSGTSQSVRSHYGVESRSSKSTFSPTVVLTSHGMYDHLQGNESPRQPPLHCRRWQVRVPDQYDHSTNKTEGREREK